MNDFTFFSYHSLLRPVTEGVFANNRLSVNLVSDNDLSGLSMFLYVPFVSLDLNSLLNQFG